MYNICIRMTGNPTDAQDMLQDAFIDAFRHLGQLKQPRAFAGWLRRIMINKCIQFSKDHIRWSSLDQDGRDTIADQETAWWLNIPFHLVQEEIKNLPGGCREVFVLYALEDFGHKQKLDVLKNLQTEINKMNNKVREKQAPAEKPEVHYLNI
jgi:RNA polymerase sigma factor (sigma-70 family)